MVAFKRAVVRSLSPVATGTLLDPEIGAAQCIADGSLPAASGLIVAIEATGYAGPSTARISRVLDGWSVEKAKLMGASAAKLLVYYHPEGVNAGIGTPRRRCRS
jgi:tagatose-1,6-bisphosphate aldolase